ncbi:MAG TPA: hypothetical protein V6D19_12960 [Stenomitos sp.]
MQRLNINSLSLSQGQQSTGFSPSSVPGLTMWVKSDFGAYNTGTTPATNGQTVTTWKNVASGGDFVQATGGSKPLFVTGVQNGLPSLRFDGIDDFMGNATFSVPATATLFIALKAVTVGVFGQRYFGFNNDNAGIFDNTTSYGYFGTQTATIVNLGGTLTTAALFTLNYAALNSCQAFRNGTSVTTFDPSNDYTNTGLAIGAEDLVGTKPTNCDIFEMIIYNTSLFAVDQAAVERYLINKWRIV